MKIKVNVGLHSPKIVKITSSYNNYPYELKYEGVKLTMGNIYYSDFDKILEVLLNVKKEADKYGLSEVMIEKIEYDDDCYYYEFSGFREENEIEKEYRLNKEKFSKEFDKNRKLEQFEKLKKELDL